MIIKVTFDDTPTRTVKVWEDVPILAVTGLSAALAAAAVPSDIADGTYTIGLGVQTNGTITFVGGRITALQQAS